MLWNSPSEELNAIIMCIRTFSNYNKSVLNQENDIVVDDDLRDRLYEVLFSLLSLLLLLLLEYFTCI